jgi:RNA polymerase sigma factor (sigma-70 family)
MNHEQLYLDNLRTIERIAGFVVRRHQVSGDEVQEFVQEVCVRLLDDDYAVIRKFEGRSSFSTFLTTVITRLYQQWRVEQWGKWRPSAEARRLGDTAITLERLLTRDGYTLHEAVATLTTRSDSSITAEQLEAIYVRLPARAPRPTLVSDEGMPESAAVHEADSDRLEQAESERSARVAARAMDDLLETFDAQDRLLLQLRFWDARKVPEIARTMQVEQKKVYKRLEKLFLTLRRGLERAGVTKSDVARLLTRGEHEISLGVLSNRGIPTSGHSHNSGGPARSGGGNPR